MNMDAAELDMLVRTHQAEIYRYLRFLGASRDVAEDVMQEAFLAALNSKSVPPDNQPGRRAAWLRGVARNCMLMHHRKYRKAATVTDPHLLQETVDQAEEYWVDQFLVGGDGFDYVQALRGCLDRLSPGQRRAVDLFYTHDASRMEMASTLNMTEDGVKSLLRRVRASLASCVRSKLEVEQAGGLMPIAVGEGGRNG